MVIFVCVRCSQRLTGGLVEVPLPPPVNEELRGPREFLPTRMPQGTFAIAPEIGGFVLCPDDLTGVDLHPDSRRRNGCCGLDGLDGPNLICAGCGAEVATKQSDCWSQQQVTLLPAAVRRR
ncbi:hypothetical protein [Spirillospora sp. CA-128828]|uniref:hypothetical protein n=1 Tax=Spirillospora sp. CA-128828 TaxID=3240033 RepID=UPI003D8C1563